MTSMIPRPVPRRLRLTTAVLLALLAAVLGRPTAPAAGSASSGAVAPATPPAPAARVSAGLLARRAQDPAAHAPVWVFFRDRGFASPAGEAAAVAALPAPPATRRAARRVAPSARDLPVAPRYLDALVRQGARLRQVSRWLNAASVELPLARLDAVAALPGVTRLEPVRVRTRPAPPTDGRLEAELAPEQAVEAVELARRPSLQMPAPRESLAPTTSYPAEEALHYGASFNQDTQIGATDMHRRGYTGAGVRVAIFDSGFRTDHRATATRHLVAQRDFVFHDDNVNNEPADLSSAWNHGTAVWSNVGGFDPGALVGAAPEAEILLAKTEDIRSETTAEEDNFVAALEWADSLGADVVSASLLYLRFDGGSGYTYAQLDGDTGVTTIACDIAVARGMAVVVANGNNGPLVGTLGTPADADSTVSVGAVDSLGVVASFSSRGPTADGRIKPEVVARGVRNYVALAGNNGYGPASGTSFATPLTGGAAALLLEAHPDWNGWQVRQALMATASHPGAPDNSSGYGLLNVRLAADSAPRTPPKLSLPFALIAPSRGSTVPTALPQLRWERSLPGAPGDTIHYAVRLAGNAAFTGATTYPAGTDTTWTPPAYLVPGQTYYWQVVATNLAGYAREAYLASRFVVSGTAAVTVAQGTPGAPRLLAPRPNPFRPATRLGFELPAFAAAPGQAATPRPYRVSVFDAGGRLRRTLRDAAWGPAALADAVDWDGRDEGGQRLPAGVYFVQLAAGAATTTTKVVLAR